MKATRSCIISAWPVHGSGLAVTLLLSGAAGAPPAHADDLVLQPGNLLVSRSVYDNNPNNVTVGESLPPGCESTSTPCVFATNDGSYPYVWNNNLVDGSFGVTAKIFLDQLTPSGAL